MTAKTAGWLGTATKVVLKTVIYYAVLVGVGWVMWRDLPHPSIAEAVFRMPQADAVPGGADAVPPSAVDTLAGTVVVAMLAALLLSIPVAWMYQLTRAKRGYQQSVVQLLIILPIVVAGIVVLVKHSLALAFSLAGIVAAVRFRNTLEDSKDAVYVFLATGLGLAAAVDVPVATVISVIFNITVLVLWYVDFGHSPVELEGRIAERRLRRAKQLARTGTFVAQIDDEVLRNMNREQLEGVAQRAWRRAHEGSSDPQGGGGSAETRLRVRTSDLDLTRRAVEQQLAAHAKQWRLEAGNQNADGGEILDYLVQLKKKGDPDDLLRLIRASAGPGLVDAELR